MDKKIECEIVQDLLIGYVDDVLKTESKKLVEKHLMECEKCREKLQEIQSNLQKGEENQRAQIDYLKKIRRRTKIKAVLLTAFVFFVIFAGWYLYKFCIINGVCAKIEKQFEGENFYIEENISCDENSVIFNKIWYKDGKYKVVSHLEEAGEVVQKFETRYGNLAENAKEEYFVNEDERKARKEKMLTERKKGDFIVSQSPFVLDSGVGRKFEFVILKLGEPFYVKISTDYKQIGRKYYVFDFGESKKWVDVETGLPIMSFGDVVGTDFYPNTNIPKQEFSSVSEYHYDFGNVADEDVQMTDLEGYEVEEFDWEKEMEKLKS